MSSDYGIIALFLGVSFLFGVITMWMSWLVRPQYITSQKLEVYECGEPTQGPTWIQFNFRFFSFVFIFVVFDIEVLFLFPFAVKFLDFIKNGLGVFIFTEVAIFILILTLALIYAWKKDALKWS